ncbi:hypothetical protein [Arthrobacter sp. ZGTC412]|uniref:hypothetical protein n=1 Tax=Arthrobacter sp. ZGTC412 TaxID=2058900 RepID=UPI0021571D87|nr:hypothetical protein [Arthrobacter sp. ZGTC412]
MRLVGAVLVEQHDEWTESRRYLGHDLIQQSQTVGNEPTAGTDMKEDTGTGLALSA